MAVVAGTVAEVVFLISKLRAMVSPAVAKLSPLP